MSDRVDDLSRDDALAVAMRELFAEVDATVASRRAVCIQRGVCCRFGRYGHRLYVTDLELAYFLRGHRGAWRAVGDEDACPYQVDGLCKAREHRPLGCRIYHCDPASQAWQGPDTERYLATLRRLGERFGVTYRYREWLSALQSLGGSDVCTAEPVQKVIPPVDGRRLTVIK